MMTVKKELLVALALLPKHKQLAFVLLIFERMLPSMIAFSKTTGYDPSCYLRSRDAAWAALSNKAVDLSLCEACLKHAPDTEEFSDKNTSYALNAAIAMSDIMEFILDSDMDHIAEVLTLADDSIHLYLSSLIPSIISFPEKSNRIAVHPMMEREKRRERDDIKFLSGLNNEFDVKTISALRERALQQPPLIS